MKILMDLAKMAQIHKFGLANSLLDSPMATRLTLTGHDVSCHVLMRCECFECIAGHDLLPESSIKNKRESQTEKHCYPRRSIARRDYTEMEVPDDDHYICE